MQPAGNDVPATGGLRYGPGAAEEGYVFETASCATLPAQPLQAFVARVAPAVVAPHATPKRLCPTGTWKYAFGLDSRIRSSSAEQVPSLGIHGGSSGGDTGPSRRRHAPSLSKLYLFDALGHQRIRIPCFVCSLAHISFAHIDLAPFHCSSALRCAPHSMQPPLAAPPPPSSLLPPHPRLHSQLRSSPSGTSAGGR